MSALALLAYALTWGFNPSQVTAAVGPDIQGSGRHLGAATELFGREVIVSFGFSFRALDRISIGFVMPGAPWGVDAIGEYSFEGDDTRDQTFAVAEAELTRAFGPPIRVESRVLEGGATPDVVTYRRTSWRTSDALIQLECAREIGNLITVWRR